MLCLNSDSTVTIILPIFRRYGKDFWNKSLFFGLFFLNQKNWEKHCFPADTNPKRSGLSPVRNPYNFLQWILQYCHLQQYAISSSYSELRGHWHHWGYRAGSRSHPCPVTRASQHPLWWAQQTAVPLPARASRTWYTCPCLTQHNFCLLLNPG